MLYRDSRTVVQADRAIEMTAREFQLLEYLLKNKNKVVSRSAILNQVWGVDAEVCDNSVDVYVGHLRKKLDLAGRLTTVRGSIEDGQPRSKRGSRRIKSPAAQLQARLPAGEA